MINRTKKTKQIIEIRTDIDNPQKNPVLARYMANYRFKIKESLWDNLFLYIFIKNEK